MNLAKLGTELARNQVLDTRDARDYAFRERQQTNTESYQKSLLAEKDKEPEAVRIARAAGIDPATPEGRKVLFPKTDTPISAGDKKVINAAEDELPAIEGTIDALKTAKDLNAKTFTGYSAGLRGQRGTSNIPGANLLVDRNSAMATKEWQTVMGAEAVKAMSDQLKGATTDFELRKFEGMLADPSTPPEIRGRVIDRMLTLADKQRAIKARRIEELRSGSYYKPQGGSTTTPTARGPTSKEEYDALPSGTPFTAPDGSQRVKP